MFLKFAASPITLFGKGCRAELPALLKRENKKHALVVTDMGLEKLGIRKQVTDLLENEGIKCEVYNKVCPNPTMDNVLEGKEVYSNNECDFIVAVGGGSANDCAKAIRMLCANEGELKDYEGRDKSKVRGSFLVAINTTAGTASEVSRAYIISDEVEKKKMIFKDDFVMPDIAVNDTEFMIKLPQSITAQTGMDAFTHAVESYLSTTGTEFTKLLAKNAMEVIWKWLPEVYENGEDEMARDQMALGQYMAGLSFGSSGLGLVHAMAHQLGALYNLPHGLCNAVLLPTVLKYYSEKNRGILKEVASILDVEGISKTEDKELDKKCIDMIEAFSDKLGTNKKLRDIGVCESDFSLLAEKTLLDGCLMTAPEKPTKEEIINLFKIIY